MNPLLDVIFTFPPFVTPQKLYPQDNAQGTWRFLLSSSKLLMEGLSMGIIIVSVFTEILACNVEIMPKNDLINLRIPLNWKINIINIE